MTDFAYSCANGRTENCDTFLYGDVNGDLLISVYDGAIEKEEMASISIKGNFGMIFKKVIECLKNRNDYKAECDKKGTFCTCLVHKNNVTVEWQGENRAYLIRKGKLYQITADDALALKEEGYMLDVVQGAFANHKITFATCDGDMIFLCTDGAYGNLSNSYIAEIWRRSLSMEEFCMSLVDTSKKEGCMDNQTIVAFGI